MNPAEQYILDKEAPFNAILMQLQVIVEATVPNAELLYKWRLPFFYANGLPLCFFNQSKDYVDLGFWHYNKMDKYQEHFVSTGRKFVRSLRYKSVEDINAEIIIYVLNEQLRIKSNPFKLVRK